MSLERYKRSDGALTLKERYYGLAVLGLSK
jgi:hypothetical protein